MHHLQNKDNYLWVYAENSGTKLVVVGLQLFRFLNLFFHWFLSKIFVQEARELNSVNGYDICNHFTLVQFKMLFLVCKNLYSSIEYLLLSVVRIPWYFCDVLASKVGLPGGLVHEDLLTFERALLIFLSFSCFLHMAISHAMLSHCQVYGRATKKLKVLFIFTNWLALNRWLVCI